MTFIGALRLGGNDAPCVFDGPIIGELFRAYVDRVLVPVLTRRESVAWADQRLGRRQKTVLVRRIGTMNCIQDAMVAMPLLCAVAVARNTGSIGGWMRIDSSPNLEQLWGSAVEPVILISGDNHDMNDTHGGDNE